MADELRRSDGTAVALFHPSVTEHERALLNLAMGGSLACGSCGGTEWECSNPTCRGAHVKRERAHSTRWSHLAVRLAAMRTVQGQRDLSVDEVLGMMERLERQVGLDDEDLSHLSPEQLFGRLERERARIDVALQGLRDLFSAEASTRG